MPTRQSLHIPHNTIRWKELRDSSRFNRTHPSETMKLKDKRPPSRIFGNKPQPVRHKVVKARGITRTSFINTLEQVIQRLRKTSTEADDKADTGAASRH